MAQWWTLLGLLVHHLEERWPGQQVWPWSLTVPSWTFSTRSRLQPAFQWRQVTDGPGPGHVSPEAGWGGRTAVG